MMAPNLTLEQLVTILDFKRDEMSQMLLVSTLMAVVAMSVVVVLVSGSERGKLRSVLLVSLTASSLIFIFATMLDVCILPAMKHNATHPVATQISGLLRLAQVVVMSLMLGSIVLFASLGSLGFVYSRRVGVWTISLAAGIFAVFAVCLFMLDAAMR